jgi:hypothetical protein
MSSAAHAPSIATPESSRSLAEGTESVAESTESPVFGLFTRETGATVEASRGSG